MKRGRFKNKILSFRFKKKKHLPTLASGLQVGTCCLHALLDLIACRTRVLVVYYEAICTCSLLQLQASHTSKCIFNKFEKNQSLIKEYYPQN